MSVTTSTENRVLTITLNRPEARNAMTREMWETLLEMLEKCKHDEDIGCVVLTGRGRPFAPGAMSKVCRRLD